MDEKRRVYIRVVFLKVGEIDTIREQFSADVFIQARWHEPELDNKTEEDVDDISKYWLPKIVVSNLLDAKKNISRHEVDFRGKDGTFIFQKHRIKGQFSERLELKEFPFDNQSLNIQISSEISNTKLELVEELEEISDIDVSNFIDEQEWHLFDFVEISGHDHVEEEMEVESKYVQNLNRKGVTKYPRLYVRFYAVRRWGYFMLNIIMMMNLISSVAFATFAVSYTLPQNRLQLSIILMLTSVTYKSVANAHLPKISYYTRMDVYIIFSMFFVLVVCIWHAVVTLFEGDLQKDLDLGAFIAFCIIFFLFHFIYGLYLVITYTQRRRNLEQKVLNYEEKVEKIHTGYRTNKEEYKRKRKRVNLKIAPDDSLLA